MVLRVYKTLTCKHIRRQLTHLKSKLLSTKRNLKPSSVNSNLESQNYKNFKYPQTLTKNFSSLTNNISKRKLTQLTYTPLKIKFIKNLDYLIMANFRMTSVLSPMISKIKSTNSTLFVSNSESKYLT
jgi:hypothetical protein